MGRNDDDDPRDLWNEALELELRAQSLRYKALAIAIKRHHGILKYVGDAVGLSRSGVCNILKVKHYRKLEEEAAEERRAAGYKIGTVPKELRPEKSE